MTEYITIQDFANKSGLSRQTVYRKLDNEWNKYYKEENGKNGFKLFCFTTMLFVCKFLGL